MDIQTYLSPLWYDNIGYHVLMHKIQDVLDKYVSHVFLKSTLLKILLQLRKGHTACLAFFESVAVFIARCCCDKEVLENVRYFDCVTFQSVHCKPCD